MRIRVRYTGRVQGVGFRATAAALARDHAVTGWVRNEHDGSVLLEAQGEESEVAALLAAIRSAMTRYIHAADQSPVGDSEGETGFRITH